MEKQPQLTVFEEDDQTRTTLLHAMAGHLGQYHRWSTGGELRQLFASLHGGSGDFLGGLIGVTHGEWLYVEFVWVNEAVRGRGYGRLLLAAAEREAIARNCGRAYLDTAASPADGFFRRCGYSVCGEIPDFLPGQYRFWMIKDLVGVTG
jgi:GNAT superfamily N-acetyltransferase